MRFAIRSGSRKTMHYLAAAALVVAITVFAVIAAPDLPKTNSEQGVLDLTRVHVAETPVKLAGEWEFYWKELLTPDDIRNRLYEDGHSDRWISIPGSWRGYLLEDRKLDSTGYATFRLIIRLSGEDRDARLALRMPSIFHAYKLWVNGQLLAEAGEVGRDRSGMTPQLVTKLAFFQPEQDTVELVMQVSNFHHVRGGITKFIELGGSDKLAVRTGLKIAAEMFITASLLIIAIYHLLLFMLRRKDKAPLFFGLFTLMFGIRSLLVGQILITQVWPGIPWELQFKIEYLILCGGGYVITRYAECIFPNMVSRWFRIGSQMVSGALCLVVLATPAIVYTRLLPGIGVVVVLHIVYLMLGLVRAAVWNTQGAGNFLLLSGVALVTVANDFLYYNEWSPVGNTSPFGLLVFTIAQMVLLSSRFTQAASNEERIARELQAANDRLTELNTNLEQAVRERTRELSEAHENLRVSYDRLLQSEQGRKKLLSYITHDLRLPLSSMLGYVEAVQDSVRPERHDQYLKYIRDNTIRVNRMIEELSFLSHLETGQIAYLMEPVDAADFLWRFRERYELVVQDAGLEFVADFGDAEGPARMIEMDEQKMEQALFNLVSNAMKFTPVGGEVLLALGTEVAENRRHAIISVRDTGPGIPPDKLEMIFDRHYRYVRPDVEKIAEGSGLGLAICREIVLGHGGTVRAESDGMSGSTFRISIPCMTEQGR